MRIASELQQPLSLLASHRLLGELAIVERRFDEAERELTQALQLADASAIRYERTLTLMELAKLHTARQEHSAARALLDEIRVHCRQLDANPLLAQIAQLERQLIGGGFPAGLSAREAQVLQLIASGMSDAEIAARLYISPRTVNRHTTSIYNKLNVNSRVAATRFAIDHQLI
jgi:DNA-binding NarL/FixJ family response regulator